MAWTLERRRDAAIEGPLLRAFTREDSQIITRPGWRQILTPSSPGYLNEVGFSQIEPDDAERIIDETIATYRAHGLRFRWFVGPWTQPADFGERLERRGFRRLPMRGMGIDTRVAFALPAASQVALVAFEPHSVDDYVATTIRAWSMPPAEEVLERASYRRALTQEPRIAHLFGATCESAWAGTAALVIREGYGYLLGAQVLEGMRGRGIYRALIEVRLAFLRSRGLEYAVTHAQEDTSAPILEHLGFETLFRSTCWTLDP